MDETELIDQFNDGLDSFVDSFVLLNDISSAAIIGALYLKIHQLAQNTHEAEEKG